MCGTIILQLIPLLKQFEGLSVLHDKEVIEYASPLFLQLVQDKLAKNEQLEGKNLVSLLKNPKVGYLHARALLSRKPQSTELIIDFYGEERLVMYSVFLAGCAKEPDKLLSMIFDLTAQRSADLAYLQKMQHCPSDNLWIFDQDLYLVWHEKQDEQLDIGGFMPDLVLARDCHRVHEICKKAQNRPGMPVSFACRLKAKPQSGTVQTLQVDLVYVPILFNQGHFLAVTRPQLFTSSAIIDRMKDALALTSDIQLAGTLNISPSAVSKARVSPKPPFNWMWLVHQTALVSFDWLLNGKGQKYL